MGLTRSSNNLVTSRPQKDFQPREYKKLILAVRQRESQPERTVSFLMKVALQYLKSRFLNPWFGKPISLWRCALIQEPVWRNSLLFGRL